MSAKKKAAKKVVKKKVAAKKVAKKAVKKVAKKAAAKKAVKKAAKKVVVKGTTKTAKGVTTDEISKAAYLLFLKRQETGMPGTAEGDWLEAERLLAK